MSTFEAAVVWNRSTPDFKYDTYDRSHQISFGSGTSITGSAAPDYMGNSKHVNPEESLLAALSSCHMLTFLAIASKSGYIIDSYEDRCSAELGKNEEGTSLKPGKLGVTKAVLRPRITFGGTKKPDLDELKKLHGKAHANCFIANTVSTNVLVEPYAE